jgi:cell division transport system permease protein
MEVPEIGSLAFFLREFISSMRSNRVVVFTYGVQVMISLLVLGYFLVLILTINRFVQQLQGMIEIHAFLDQGLSAQDILRVEKDLKGVEGVSQVKFISAEEALENFVKTTGIELDSLLEQNPLPATYVVRPGRVDEVEKIAEQVRRVQGVSEIRYGRDIVVKLSKALFIFQIIFGVTILLLLGASFSSINNIVRLSIHSRRKEIRIMQLVGATKWFIRWPFIFEGLFIGILGSLVAALLVWASYVGLSELIEGLKVFKGALGGDARMIIFVGAALVASGAIVGVASSVAALENYLAEDERIVIETARIRRELEWR